MELRRRQGIVSAGSRQIDRQAEVYRRVTRDKAVRNSSYGPLTVILLLRREDHPRLNDPPMPSP